MLQTGYLIFVYGAGNGGAVQVDDVVDLDGLLAAATWYAGAGVV